MTRANRALAAPGTVTAARRASRSFNRLELLMGRSHPGYAPSASLAHDGLYEKAGAIWTKSSLAGAGNVPTLVMSGRENVLQPSQTINLPRVKELVIAGWTGRDVAAL